MECIIDCRENKILDKLKESNKFAFLVHQLDLGDIIIKNGIRKLIIERKTWDDLKSSLKDGRFREQRSRLLLQTKNEKDTKICYLIEGYYNENYEIEKKTLFRLQFAYNIPVIYSKTLFDTIEILDTWIKLENLDSYFVARDSEIDQVESRLKNQLKKNYDDSSIFFLETLTSIKGITSIIAKQIADEFKSVYNFCLDFHDNPESWTGRITALKYTTKKNNEKKIKSELIDKIKINFHLKKIESQV